jgi:heme exporter protein C
MNAFTALILRDMRLAVRVGGGALMGALFFLIVVVMMPFALGPDLALLARIGPAILWLGALLASLLALDRLFAIDYDDGSLDLLMMGRLPLELAVAAKAIAHWLTTALPLVVISPVLGMMRAGTDFARRHAGAHLHRLDRRRAFRDAATRRSAVGGLGIAVDDPGADLRRRSGERRHCRARALRPSFHHSLCSILGLAGARALRRGRSAAARTGIAMAVIDLANPTRFLNIVNRVLPWLAAATVLLFAFGLARAINAPDDYQQGATVKIMFLHVPSAWLGMMGWGLMSAAALGTLVWRHPLADVAGKAAAPIGAAFTFLCLITGSLWGRPTWGTYWVWDARLTSVLVLFLLYLGVLALYWTAEDPGRGSRAAAILTLVGAVNIPIIKFSVDWWNTLHQPASILRMGGSAIDPSILWPLLIMTAAFTLLFATLFLAAMRNEILRRRVRAMRLIQAQEARA